MPLALVHQILQYTIQIISIRTVILSDTEIPLQKKCVTHEDGGDCQPSDSVRDADLPPYKEVMDRYKGS
jgi:hypothetical protein